MRVSRISDFPKEPFGSRIFTAENVTKQAIMPDSAEYEINVVNFGKGVRLKFHSHSQEQILVVTAGKGIVATEDEQREVGPGDVIFIPAHEKHWHGAAPDTEFSHIFIYRRGTRYKQLKE